MSTIIKEYADGRRAIKKTTRKPRLCGGCGNIIPSGNELIAIQTHVVYRKAYWRDDEYYCMNCHASGVWV